MMREKLHKAVAQQSIVADDSDVSQSFAGHG
jgi:hypothetical protein